MNAGKPPGSEFPTRPTRKDAMTSYDPEPIRKAGAEIAKDLTLRKIKIHEALSEETLCFSAEIIFKGEFRGTVGNRGTGGPDDFSDYTLSHELDQQYGLREVLSEAVWLHLAAYERKTEIARYASRLKRKWKTNPAVVAVATAANADGVRAVAARSGESAAEAFEQSGAPALADEELALHKIRGRS